MNHPIATRPQDCNSGAQRPPAGMSTAVWAKAGCRRLARKYARLLYRRPFLIKSGVPIVSFTFDDFPRSAFLAGGSILRRFGAAGTYYTSFGLMGANAPSGAAFLASDLEALVEQGHELGSHTFNHCHPWKTQPAVFETSVIENQQALNAILPGASFRTFSYPLSAPRPGTKRRISRHFLCCRGGGLGQTLNAGIVDLNGLSAFFLERSRENPDAVKDLIDRNCRERGWLIFATHDISGSPSPYGCSLRFFEDVVQYAVSSGSRILTVMKACEFLQGTGSHGVRRTGDS